MSVTDPSVFHVDGFVQEDQDLADAVSTARKNGISGKKKNKRSLKGAKKKKQNGRKRRMTGGSKGNAHARFDDESDGLSDSDDEEEESESESETEEQGDVGQLLALEACMEEWKKSRKFDSTANQRAMALCWDAVSRVASKAMKGLGGRETGAFLKHLEQSCMRTALVFGGDDVSDNEIWTQHLCAELERDCTPHIALVGAKECVSAKSTIQSLALQLKVSLDEEAQRIGSCGGSGNGSLLTSSTSETKNQGTANGLPNRRRRVAALRAGDSIRDLGNEGQNLVSGNMQRYGEMPGGALLSTSSGVTARRAAVSRKRYDMHDLEQIFEEHFTATNLFRRSNKRNGEEWDGDIGSKKQGAEEESTKSSNDQQQQRIRPISRPSAIVIFEDAANIDPTVLRETLVILSHYHTNPDSCLRFAVVAGLQGGNYLWNIDSVLRRREADKFSTLR